MIRKNIKTGEEIYIDSNGKCYKWDNNWCDPKFVEIENFCITNDWKKK